MAGRPVRLRLDPVRALADVGPAPTVIGLALVAAPARWRFMMELGKHDVVGGFISTHEESSAAAQESRVTVQAVDAGAQTHRAARSEAAELGNGVVNGVIAGIVVGAALGIALLFAALPPAMVLEARVLLLGAIIGGFWGSFFGGLAGMAIKASGHES